MQRGGENALVEVSTAHLRVPRKWAAQREIPAPQIGFCHALTCPRQHGMPPIRATILAIIYAGNRAEMSLVIHRDYSVDDVQQRLSPGTLDITIPCRIVLGGSGNQRIEPQRVPPGVNVVVVLAVSPADFS